MRRRGTLPQSPYSCVYFLELNNGHIYVGSTDDLRRRVHSHRSGRVLSTKRLLPAKLKSYVAVENEPIARSMERYFKSGSGKAFAKKRFLGQSMKLSETDGSA